MLFPRPRIDCIDCWLVISEPKLAEIVFRNTVS